MSGDRVIKRLTVLRDEAEREPLPTRKFFHIGQPEVMEDLGEVLPMIAWVDDNLSRFVVADGPASTWSPAAEVAHAPIDARADTAVIGLPNIAVHPGEGVFLVTVPGESHSVAHPGGKGSMHFVHLGSRRRLWDRGIPKIYIYRLEGLQMKTVIEKKR